MQTALTIIVVAVAMAVAVRYIVHTLNGRRDPCRDCEFRQSCKHRNTPHHE